MFRKKFTIVFVIIAFGFLLGLICGVTPGYFLKNYALFGISLGIVIFVFAFLLLITFLFEYFVNENTILFTDIRIFHSSLTTRDKILLTFSCLIFFNSGILLGMICELIFKAIGVSFIVHIITGSICVFLLLIIFLIIIISDVQKDSQLKHELRSSVSRLDSPNDSTMSTKPMPNIQKEYHKLVTSSKKFSLNEKVYTNENDLAQIIEIHGFGNYRIRYLRNGLTDFKNGNELQRV